MIALAPHGHQTLVGSLRGLQRQARAEAINVDTSRLRKFRQLTSKKREANQDERKRRRDGSKAYVAHAPRLGNLFQAACPQPSQTASASTLQVLNLSGDGVCSRAGHRVTDRTLSSRQDIWDRGVSADVLVVKAADPFSLAASPQDRAALFCAITMGKTIVSSEGYNHGFSSKCTTYTRALRRPQHVVVTRGFATTHPTWAQLLKNAAAKSAGKWIVEHRDVPKELLRRGWHLHGGRPRLRRRRMPDHLLQRHRRRCPRPSSTPWMQCGPSSARYSGLLAVSRCGSGHHCPRV